MKFSFQGRGRSGLRFCPVSIYLGFVTQSIQAAVFDRVARIYQWSIERTKSAYGRPQHCSDNHEVRHFASQPSTTEKLGKKTEVLELSGVA